MVGPAHHPGRRGRAFGQQVDKRLGGIARGECGTHVGDLVALR